MRLSVSTRPFKSILLCVRAARPLFCLLFHQHQRVLRSPGRHSFHCAVARCSAVCILATAILLQPALASGRKSFAINKPKKESAAYPTQQDIQMIEENILRFTNNERNIRGLPAFQRSPALAYLSGRQSENMCATRTLEHESDVFPKGWKKFTDRMKIAGLTSAAENIAYRTLREQPEKWAKEIVSGWMKSPQHRKNILNPRWRYLGVGVQMCANRIAYATQVFSSDPGRIH